MKLTVSACIVGGILLGATAPAHAAWLILKGGKKIETDGPWVLKDDLLTVHETTGRITTVATAIVDSAASTRANGRPLDIQVLHNAKPIGAVPVAPSSLAARPTPNPGLPRSASLPTAAIPGALAASPRPASPTRPAAIANPVSPASAAAKPSAAGVARARTSTPSGAALAHNSAPAPAAHTGAGISSTAAAPAAASPAGDAAPATAPTNDPDLIARKLAEQQRLRREAADRKVVDDCAQLYPLDQATFQACVTATRRAAHPQP